MVLVDCTALDAKLAINLAEVANAKLVDLTIDHLHFKQQFRLEG